MTSSVFERFDPDISLPIMQSSAHGQTSGRQQISMKFVYKARSTEYFTGELEMNESTK